ncbi:hypothetical protein SAMN05444161_8383 [Rhizobiales bacterium GAS191]|nr:hypothetical protein SAMN05444161_8383 [Rhizobiales bacterium GAS191]
MRRQRANTFVGISDFLLALNNVIFILFIFAIMAMAAKVPPAAGVELKAEYIITAEWDLAHDCDVDLWVRDPLGNVVYWSHKEAGSMHLDHDSRGSLSDEQRLADGTIVKPKSYGEMVTLRGIVPGEYTVNLHLYGAMIDGAEVKAPGTAYSVPVHVRIIKLNPSVVTEFDQEPTLERIWQETTVTRFGLGSDGSWLGTDPTPMSLQHI